MSERLLGLIAEINNEPYPILASGFHSGIVRVSKSPMGQAFTIPASQVKEVTCALLTIERFFHGQAQITYEQFFECINMIEDNLHPRTKVYLCLDGK